MNKQAKATNFYESSHTKLDKIDFVRTADDEICK